jgi:NitT/TauT family transport system ATP-binding protein
VREFSVGLDREKPREELFLSDSFNEIRNEVWLAVRREARPSAH